jgi:putative Ca2+/H+ antiporter (TMEM165/GDT1 family)
MWRRKEEEHEGPAASAKPPSFLRATAGAFGVVFLAEWGDLTQLGTATLAARYGRPFIVFSAATAALWCVAGLAVLAGHRAAKLLDPARTKRLAAVVFAVLGALLVVGVL